MLPSLCRLLAACVQAGLDAHGVVIPAYIRALAAGHASSADVSSGSRQAWLDWRAQCRRCAPFVLEQPHKLGRNWS